jgi:adenylosuccinate synthase
MIADIVVGLQYGDCGKGKITHHLCSKNKYTHVLRFNGGCNAGHTIYHNGKKFVTHHIPCGVFYDIPSIIGPRCVIDPDKFLKEVEELEKAGIKASELVKISLNAHVITDFHKIQDSKDTKIGTTKRGNGPAYRDKYDRKGVRAIEVPQLEPFLVDVYQILHDNEEVENVEVLCEGAQGFGLDIDWGDYPFVTSSHCTVGGAILNGVPPQSIRDVWGVGKVYETYVGEKAFEGPEPTFETIRELGEEFGATTGRPRQINWLDMDILKMAMNINGVTKLVLNKYDILKEIDKWCLYSGMNLFEFTSGDDMKFWIENELKRENLEIFFSESKEKI